MKLDSPNTPAAEDLFRDAMARFTSSITAITINDGVQNVGVLATSVCSLSATPPTILACINKSASVHDAIIRAEVFAVNLLSDRQGAIAQRFTSEKGAARFDPTAWHIGASGAPLLYGSTVSLDCRLIATHEGYSHTILIGEIIDTVLHDDPDSSALLWHRRGFASALPLNA